MTVERDISSKDIVECFEVQGSRECEVSFEYFYAFST